MFSGNYFRTNVIGDVFDVESADICHNYCQEKADNGCKHYVWERRRFLACTSQTLF